jgi:hypothetical protein
MDIKDYKEAIKKRFGGNKVTVRKDSYRWWETTIHDRYILLEAVVEFSKPWNDYESDPYTDYSCGTSIQFHYSEKVIENEMATRAYQEIAQKAFDETRGEDGFTSYYCGAVILLISDQEFFFKTKKDPNSTGLSYVTTADRLSQLMAQYNLESDRTLAVHWEEEVKEKDRLRLEEYNKQCAKYEEDMKLAEDEQKQWEFEYSLLDFESVDVEYFDDWKIGKAFFPSLNKNNTIEEYLVQEKGRSEDMAIQAVIDLNEEQYEFFCENLMIEYPFIAELVDHDIGGHTLLKTDPRIDEIHYYNGFHDMPEELQNYYKTNSYASVAIVRCGNKSLAVNTEGYRYARYVGVHPDYLNTKYQEMAYIKGYADGYAISIIDKKKALTNFPVADDETYQRGFNAGFKHEEPLFYHN